MRKRQAKKRPILPDPKFNDQLVTRFVNMMMWDGKKSVAFKICLLYTSPSPRDMRRSRMPSSA